MEALAFADQIGVMQAGQLIQVDAPEALYHQPQTAFVASFLGLTNLLDVQAEGCTGQSAIGPLMLQRSAMGPVQVSIRPEHLELLPADTPRGVAVRVLHREFRGHDTLYQVEVLDTQLRLQVIAPFNQTLAANSPAVLRVRQPAVVVSSAV